MRTTTKELIKSIYIDSFPCFAAQIDFGIHPSKDPTRVFGAFQAGLKKELFTESELDNALGDGPMLTQLVNRGDNPYGRNLIIKTAWDNIPDEDEDEYEAIRFHAEADMQEKQEAYATKV